MAVWRLSALAVLAAAAANAAAPPPILPPSRFDPAALLPPPPANGSLQAAAEVAELRTIDAQRTPAMLAAAKSDSDNKTAAIFAAALGPHFDLARLPRTAALMDMVRGTEKAAADRAKAYFRRSRPWVANPGLHHCGKDDDANWSSYPSGHATMGYSMAAVLARLLPADGPQLMARAASYGQSRLLCEVHFRSDVSAGQALGLMVAERLFEDPGFRRSAGLARAELRAAGVR